MLRKTIALYYNKFGNFDYYEYSVELCKFLCKKVAAINSSHATRCELVQMVFIMFIIIIMFILHIVCNLLNYY